VSVQENRFDWLSRRAQIGWLRRLARTALADYDLGEARLTLLAHLYNTTFRVDTAGGQRYVLRIHRAGTPTVESVGAELSWLAALRRDTDLQVPAPVPARSGKLLTVAAVPGVGPEGTRPHICVVFRWLTGRRVNTGLKPAHLEIAGTLMARLQDHATQFGPPPGFARGRVDWPVETARGLPDPFAPEVIAACHDLVAGALSAEEAAQVTAVLERVRAAEHALGQGPAAFGLIHADLHQYNLLFEHGAVRAIDFDDCGFGPLLYDLAVPLSELYGRAEYPALRAGLLAGYRRVRPLSAEHEACVDTFIALRRVQDGLWALQARKHPAIISGDWATQARTNMAPLAGFLASGGRLPN
jgi:Ser/Thr protein kinase RdoA (MazF antagonist)